MKAVPRNQIRPMPPLAAGGARHSVRAVPSPSDAGAHGVPRPTSAALPASPATRHPSRRSAVALVITLIMISVITFLAITFLALSRRERGQATTTLDQTTARFAADTAQDRALAELQATILANQNPFNFDLLVSTNFINPLGYDPSSAVYDQRTNVNFDYLNDAAASALTLDQPKDNLSHLLFSPRAPVYLNNKFYGSNEFRFYLDLNRDSAFTRNGWLIVTNPSGGFYDLNGKEIAATKVLPNQPPPANVLVRYFTGDPEFIGVLLRPEFPHSASNYFLSRYAYLVVPAGKTLDVNYIHNYARMADIYLAAGTGDAFRRNQGVAPWENNLASFLVDLNTNAWPGPNQTGSRYEYYPDSPTLNRGAAFDDALAFLRYRYATNYQNLDTVAALYPPEALNPSRPTRFWNDGVDAYALSPLMSNVFGLVTDLDTSWTADLSHRWSGAENPNHLFTTQDFFDQSTLPLSFVTRLNGATTNSPSSYDRYTYYRMLAQLGTDSAPDPDSATAPGGKLNVNFINLPPFKTTNFVSWRDPQVLARLGRPGSDLFFSNAVDRLVRRFTSDWLNRSKDTFTNVFGMTTNFGADRIPVFVNGRFVYPPSLHRQLQVAANIWDAVNPSNNLAGGLSTPLPTVFQPIFKREGLNIYINDFREITSADQLTGTLRDLSNTNVAANVQPDDRIFGVPLIIGARKGLPNFNEFSSEAVVQITRKAELVKSSVGGASKIFQTNQMFVIGISNSFGAEFWNSYASYYQRPVIVEVTNFYAVELTNDYNFKSNTTIFPTPSGQTNLAVWPKYSGASGGASFIVPLRSNHIVLADSVYRQASDSFVSLTKDVTFERPSGFAFPRWGLSITNRVVALIKDSVTGRLLDYVQLNGMTSYRDLAAEIAEPPPGRAGVGGFGFLWATNFPDPGRPLLLGDFIGVYQQILVSGGEEWGFPPAENWKNNGINQPSGATRDQAIANFLAFFENSGTHVYQPSTGGRFDGTNFALVATVPFTPTKKFSIQMFWQANDPLVHYNSSDLEDLESNENLDVLGIKVDWTPPSLTTNTLANLGKLNKRYRPWGGYPLVPPDGEEAKLAFNSALKDSGLRRSDDWQFPTNHLPTLGWLGRVHRGTPWQTVYLKSTRAEDDATLKAKSSNGDSRKPNEWQKWSGNRIVWRDGASVMNDAYLNQPEQDRNWLDLFSTALNDSATRGQLPINQSGLAAWSAVFGGMLALTNTYSDDDLINLGGPSALAADQIYPAGVFDPANATALPALAKVVAGINNTRTNKSLFPLQSFTRLGDLLATPELTEASPFLNHSQTQQQLGLSDAVVEWLPQQMLSLVRLGEPRFVIYSFGQTLKPAPRSIQVSGSYFQMCTNYQITAEVATRSVVKVIGSPDPATANPNSPKYEADADKRYPLRLVQESFNVLPPD